MPDSSFSDDALQSLDAVDLSDFHAQRKRDFDLIVIGSGPAGRAAALTAARSGARVGLVEREPLAGGVYLNTGTVPSKSLREAVIYLTGYRQRGYYGDDYRLKDRIQAGDLVERTNHVIHLERMVINEALHHAGVIRLVGDGRVAGPHHVAVRLGGEETIHTTGSILVAVGTQPRRPSDIPFDEVNVFDSDDVFGNDNDLRPLPDSIVVLGAGVIGIEYANMFAALDIPTTLIDNRESPLGFVDEDIAQCLFNALEKKGMRLIFGTEVEKVYLDGEKGDHRARVLCRLASGEEIDCDSLLFAQGRVPLTKHLGLAEAGVELGKRGHIEVDENYRTNIPSIYAAGDAIGFPSLASTSSEQGRVAAMNALGQPVTWHPEVIPYGIYTIPEISMVGKTEQEAREAGIDYFTGSALWRETARGNIIGDMNGALKLVFDRATHQLIGVHLIGEGATELVHIGQTAMHFGAGPEYFRDTVFNVPTLAEAYKIAAANALIKLENPDFSRGSLVQRINEPSPREWAQYR